MITKKQIYVILAIALIISAFALTISLISKPKITTLNLNKDSNSNNIKYENSAGQVGVSIEGNGEINGS